jgi:hypothetical protein
MIIKLRFFIKHKPVNCINKLTVNNTTIGINYQKNE